jgi:hypothetical protein
MVSAIPPVGRAKNERFLSCDAVLLGVRYVDQILTVSVLVKYTLWGPCNGHVNIKSRGNPVELQYLLRKVAW